MPISNMATTHYNGAPQYYIVDGSKAPIGLTNGGQKGPTSYAGWSATQVEKNGDHYEILWIHPTSKTMKSGRLMHQATSSQVLKLSYGKMKLSLTLISMGMEAVLAKIIFTALVTIIFMAVLDTILLMVELEMIP